MGVVKYTGGESGQIIAYLSPVQKQVLINYLALEGTSYNNYLKWTQENDIPLARRYTESSWKSWLKIHRAQIKALREELKISLGRGTAQTRKRRLAALEDDLVVVMRAMADVDLTTTAGKELWIKLSEQKRRLLQAVAQQRGEWGTKMEDDKPTRGPASLAAQFERYFERMGTSEDSDGEEPVHDDMPGVSI